MMIETCIYDKGVRKYISINTDLIRYIEEASWDAFGTPRQTKLVFTDGTTMDVEDSKYMLCSKINSPEKYGYIG
jgi:hypothetical protein